MNETSSTFEFSSYRPPHWESPIEKQLWAALRYIGVNVETQVEIGNFRVDMIVSSRLNSNRAIVECDGAEFHHRYIDEFRDDELLELAGLPIAHVYGKSIFESAETCALYIIERWFPELMDNWGYIATLAMVYGEKTKNHVDGCSGFFPVGYVRPVSGDLYPSRTNIEVRELTRYITRGSIPTEFANQEDKDRLLFKRAELKKAGLLDRKLSPQELARAYIIIYYEEPYRSDELKRFDDFLLHISSKNNKDLSYIGQAWDKVEVTRLADGE